MTYSVLNTCLAFIILLWTVCILPATSYLITVVYVNQLKCDAICLQLWCSTRWFFTGPASVYAIYHSLLTISSLDYHLYADSTQLFLSLYSIAYPLHQLSNCFLLFSLMFSIRGDIV